MSGAPEHVIRCRARVFACLRPGFLTVIVGAGSGMADGGIHLDVPTDVVPIDLRLPNSEFTLLVDPQDHQFVGVER